MSISLLLLISLLISGAGAANITAVLSGYPNLSSFSALLATTSLAASLPSPVSLLAVPNDLLTTPKFPSSSTSLSDLLRLHILLRNPPDPPPPSGILIPTLLQSTGRFQFPLLNFSFDPDTRRISVSTTSDPPSTAIVISTVRRLDTDVSITVIDSLLAPNGFGRLDEGSSSKSPPVNITKALTDSHGFNIFGSILAASGVIEELQNDESGAGLSIFVPTDQAFANISPAFGFQSLSAEKKAVILRFHCLRSYYPLGSLQKIVNPLQPTLATEMTGAGKYTLNVSSANGTLLLDTSIVQSTVPQTIFDENPVAIFGVPVVLLPREIFGGIEVAMNEAVDRGVGSPAFQRFDAPPSPVGAIKSMAEGYGTRGLGQDHLVCIGLLYLLVLM